MASPTFSITGIVVGHTKLGETDMIITILAEDGSQYKAVAKGARKPTSTFASRLELFSVATILLAQGKNLDIVKEARLVTGNACLRSDYLLSSAASPIVELLAKATFQDQPTPRLFELAKRALEELPAASEPLAITLATLLKLLAFLGFRPTFQECVSCGSALDLQAGGSQAFSYFDGGSICPHCIAEHETTYLDAGMLAWCNGLLYTTLEEASKYELLAQTLVQSFTFVNEWIKLHLGVNMRSITYLFKNALFPNEV